MPKYTKKQRKTRRKSYRKVRRSVTPLSTQTKRKKAAKPIYKNIWGL